MNTPDPTAMETTTVMNADGTYNVYYNNQLIGVFTATTFSQFVELSALREDNAKLKGWKERLKEKVNSDIVQAQKCFDSAVDTRSPDQADYWLHERNLLKKFKKLIDETE